MRQLRRWVVAVVMMAVITACSSDPALPTGLVSRTYVEHLARHPGTDKVEAKLVATDGVPTDPTGLHICSWPKGCKSRYSFVWLREEIGQYPEEAPLGSDRPMVWIVTAVDARSGRLIGTGAVLGPNNAGWPNFNRARDLAKGTDPGQFRAR